MNVKKPADYSALFAALDALLTAKLPQIELYCEIGHLTSDRSEKGAAVAVAEYLKDAHPDVPGFSPRNLRRMRDFYRTYADKVLASAVYYPNGLGDDAPAGFPASMCCLTVDFYETETFGHLWRGVYMAEFTTIDPDEFAQGWMDFLLNCVVVDRDDSIDQDTKYT